MIGPTMPDLRTRQMWVLPQDAGVRRDGRILTASVPVAYEDLEAGPIGHRVQVVDYDASTQTLYRPARVGEAGPAPPSDAEILDDPAFHAQNVYALVMRTLARFEFALGRRVAWGFRGAPAEGRPARLRGGERLLLARGRVAAVRLLPRRGRRRRSPACRTTSWSTRPRTPCSTACASRFMEPSSPDQAAFHEGFADIVALLSVFSLGDVLGAAARRATRRRTGTRAPGLIAIERGGARTRLMQLGAVRARRRDGGGAPDGAGQRPAPLGDDRARPRDPRPAGVPGAAPAGRGAGGGRDAGVPRRLDVAARVARPRSRVATSTVGRVAEEGADVADQLLTMAIRALDYTPPIHLAFGDYLSALLTADSEVRSDDRATDLRATLLDWFGRYGIVPASGTHRTACGSARDLELGRQGVHFGSLQTDRDRDVPPRVGQPRRAAASTRQAYTRVSSVRPCLRIVARGRASVRETVAECHAVRQASAPTELPRYGLDEADGHARRHARSSLAAAAARSSSTSTGRSSSRSTTGCPTASQGRRPASGAAAARLPVGARVLRQRGQSLAARLRSTGSARADGADRARRRCGDGGGARRTPDPRLQRRASATASC